MSGPRSLYSPEFDAFWKSYSPPKLSSKIDASKAFKQIKQFLPAQPVFLACVELYNNFLHVENATRAKRGQADHQKCHAATWLRQHRWEGYQHDAESLINQRESALSEKANADGRIAGLRSESEMILWTLLESEIGEDAMSAWFSDALLCGRQIIVYSSFKADYIRSKFQAKLVRIFGDDITIATQ